MNILYVGRMERNGRAGRAHTIFNNFQPKNKGRDVTKYLGRYAMVGNKRRYSIHSKRITWDAYVQMPDPTPPRAPSPTLSEYIRRHEQSWKQGYEDESNIWGYNSYYTEPLKEDP